MYLSIQDLFEENDEIWCLSEWLDKLILWIEQHSFIKMFILCESVCKFTEIPSSQIFWREFNKLILSLPRTAILWEKVIRE